LRREKSIVANTDWLTILLYGTLVIMGWLNIYAAVYDESLNMSIFDFNLNSGKQLLWIGSTVVIFITVMTIDFKFYESFAYVIYGAVILLLLLVLVFGTEVSGAKSWFIIGGVSLQPSEFAKFATALAVAKYINTPGFHFSKMKNLFSVGALAFFPMALIILQPDTGTALVFAAFAIVFYREGLSQLAIIIGLALIIIFIITLMFDKIYIIIAIALIAALTVVFTEKNIKRITTNVLIAVFTIGIVFSVDFVINNVLKPHHQRRIKVLINPDIDPLGSGWNVTQSKIAIGSGGFWGKGFLQGTQTKFDFVPEQSTDFIFCTLGEEHGWIGSFIVIVLFATLMVRVINLAERQKSRFSRVYGYSVASILFLHFMINVGMTIGLFPVIGIPLPFFSYGGSSLWAFSILLFILLKLDAHRGQLMQR